MVSPKRRIRRPTPPPSVSPPAPVWETTPAGTHEPVLLGGAVDLAEQRAAADGGAAGHRVDAHPVETAEVDHEPVVADAVAGHRVAAGADRDRQVVRARVADRGGDVLRRDGARDQRGAPVVHGVPDPAQLVVAVVAGPDDLAPEPLDLRLHTHPLGVYSMRMLGGKVLGLGCGQLRGSAEILLIAALRAAEAAGAEVELVRLEELHLPSGPDAPEPDDAWWYWERLVEADALVVSTPVISRTVAARVKLLGDRLLGPNADAAIIEELVRIEQAGGEPAVPFRVDERVLKPRVAGFIAVGGSLTPRWKTLTLPVLHTLTFSMQIAVVDQIQSRGRRHAALDRARRRRARRAPRSSAATWRSRSAAASRTRSTAASRGSARSATSTSSSCAGARSSARPAARAER